MNLGEDAMDTVGGHDSEVVRAASLPVQRTSDDHVAVLGINAEDVVLVAVCNKHPHTHTHTHTR